MSGMIARLSVSTQRRLASGHYRTRALRAALLRHRDLPVLLLISRLRAAEAAPISAVWSTPEVVSALPSAIPSRTGDHASVSHTRLRTSSYSAEVGDAFTTTQVRTRFRRAPDIRPPAPQLCQTIAIRHRCFVVQQRLLARPAIRSRGFQQMATPIFSQPALLPLREAAWGREPELGQAFRL